MRTRVAETLALTLLAGAASLTWGQQPTPSRELKTPEAVKPQPSQQGGPPRKSSLEDILSQALRNNADILVANAKLAEAEAKLKRTRLEVAQKVVAAYNAIQTHKAVVKQAEAKYKRVKNLYETRAVEHAILEEAEQALTLAKAKLAELEADLPYLLGKEPLAGKATAQTGARGGAGAKYFVEIDYDDARDLALASASVPAKPEIRGAMAERIRKALDSPMTALFKDTPLREVLKKLKDAAPGIVIQVKVNSSYDTPLSGQLEDISLGAVLEWLQDSLQGDAPGEKVHIVVREYGLLILSGEVPSGAVPLRDFWKKGASKSAGPGASIKEELKRLLKEKPSDANAAKIRDLLKQLEREAEQLKGKEESGKNAPAQDVEGLIKKVDKNSSLVTITIGSDAGLSKGHTLDVYRLKPTPKYLGRIRILETTATEAVGQAASKWTTPPQPGDRVSSRILEK